MILSDGDVVFQPHKIHDSGLYEVFEGVVLIYIHKEAELEDVEHRYPADQYVLIDDKLRILIAVKKAWDQHVTTVFVRQGHYAMDEKAISSCSSFVCISVLHSRFFDIKKNAAPHNERLDASLLSSTWNLIEKVVAHIWLLGFILLAVARWNDR